MNLYLISQSKNVDFDTYSDAVVAAETPEAATLIHPDGTAIPIDQEKNQFSTWVSDPAKVEVQLIGTAVDEIKAGSVICSSYHAG